MEQIKSRAENAPDLRQQNKIIKIAESGDLDVLNQPLAAVSADERDSFLGKIRDGKITGETLDKDIISNIGAPFSGRDGVQTLRDQLQNNQRLQRDFTGALRDSLYKGARYQEGQQLAPEDLARFVESYPTPRSFDEAFVSDRLQQLQAAFEQEQLPGRRDSLKAEITLQRQKENEAYPRLRAALYGKRNEYWEQGKMLLRQGKPEEPQIEKASETLEVPKTVETEGAKEAEPVIPTPSPIEQSLPPETVAFMRDHVIESDLSYQDAALPEEAKRRTLDWSKKSESAKKYAESLLQLSQRTNLESVRREGRELTQTMQAEAARIGIPVSPYGKSMTWAMWDIGKQNYFFTHQTENDSRYELDDPLTSETKREEIVNRHLGWEAYSVYRSNTAPEWKQKIAGDPRFAPALELLNKPSKQNGTLSSKDLAELGERLRHA